VVGPGRAAERSIDRENRDKKDASGNQDKQSHQRLFGFWAHHPPLLSGSLVFGLRNYQAALSHGAGNVP
jgi:hypothetical protein